MTVFKIDNTDLKSKSLPAFSMTIDDTYTTAIYSDTDMQFELVKALQKKGFTVFDRQDGLYERLTIEDNIAFYHKWFGCQTPVAEILVMFELQNCATIALRKGSTSEIARVYYAKYYMMGATPHVFQEPIHGVDVLTTNTFMNMLQRLMDNKTPVLILVSNMEHALLLGDVAYKLQEKGLHEVEIKTEENDDASKAETTTKPSTANVFKIPAKVDDKVILFDPPEIDYIESQGGKPIIVVNNESFTMDSTLAEIEKKLEIYGFYRCHRSYIVNLQKVREIITWSKNTYSLRIDNQKRSTIPLSRTKLQDIQEIFSLK